MSDHHCCYIAATHYSGNIFFLLFAASHQPASLQEVNPSVYKVQQNSEENAGSWCVWRPFTSAGQELKVGQNRTIPAIIATIHCQLVNLQTFGCSSPKRCFGSKQGVTLFWIIIHPEWHFRCLDVLCWMFNNVQLPKCEQCYDGSEQLLNCTNL